MSNETIRIAIQKSGRLTEKTLQILKQSGLEFNLSNNVLFSQCEAFPVELMLVRDDDIPEYVADGICELGFVGFNVLQEKILKKGQSPDNIPILKHLGYGNCRLSLAISKEEEYTGLNYFNGKKIVTSYPKSLGEYFAKNDINAEIIEISGSVEVTPKLKIADAICDIVSSGATLKGNNLKEVDKILDSESILVKTPKELKPEQEQTIDRLLARLEGVMKSQRNKYIMMNADKDSLARIKEILPGVDEPSVMPLAGDDGRVAVHLVCEENVFWETMENLKSVGASSILVLPIEKFIS